MANSAQHQKPYVLNICITAIAVASLLQSPGVSAREAENSGKTHSTEQRKPTSARASGRATATIATPLRVKFNADSNTFALEQNVFHSTYRQSDGTTILSLQ
jgi:hypothetical protein